MSAHEFREVKGAARMKFNEKHYKDCVFDLQIFNFADLLMPSYNGGYWKYVEDDITGVAFYVLDGEPRQTLRNFSGECFEMNDALAGMIITLFAIGHRVERQPDDELIVKYHALQSLIYDYAEELDETTQAYKMLD